MFHVLDKYLIAFSRQTIVQKIAPLTAETYQIYAFS